jgi:hypothetical protein
MKTNIWNEFTKYEKFDSPGFISKGMMCGVND